MLASGKRGCGPYLFHHSARIAFPSVHGRCALTDYGAWSLLPAALTLGVAFSTRQVLLGLAVGVVTGAVVVFGHSGEWGDLNLLTRFVVPSVGTPQFAWILIYFWCLGGVLGLWQRTGAANHFARVVGSKIARDRRGAKVFGWVLGCVFHQGGTISTILTGTTVKPVADKHGVSHEELAYIVDSTASPVATVVPFSAWPLTIGGLVAGLGIGDLVLAETSPQAVGLFVEAIPFNFYAWFALLLTLLLAVERLPWVGRRMAAAIERARTTGALDAPGARPLRRAATAGPSPGDTPRYRVGLEDFLVPLVVMLLVAIGPYLWRREIAMGEAVMTAAVASLVLTRVKGLRTEATVEAFVEGARGMTFGAILIALAMSLATVSEQLGAATYLVSSVGSQVLPWLLPGALMLLCMITSFSVGSSFGTYVVVFPIAIPLVLTVACATYGLAGERATATELARRFPDQWADVMLYFHVCFGAVMGGGVFGDQCSPVSDTTILSSMFTGCDVMDHVRTQLPLALVAAAMATLVATGIVLSI